MRRSTAIIMVTFFAVVFVIGYAVLFWPHTLPRLKVVSAHHFSGYTIVTLRNISGKNLRNVTVIGTIMRDSYHFDLISADETFDVRLYGTAYSVTILYDDGLSEELEF